MLPGLNLPIYYTAVLRPLIINLSVGHRLPRRLLFCLVFWCCCAVAVAISQSLEHPPMPLCRLAACRHAALLTSIVFVWCFLLLHAAAAAAGAGAAGSGAAGPGGVLRCHARCGSKCQCLTQVNVVQHVGVIVPGLADWIGCGGGGCVVAADARTRGGSSRAGLGQGQELLHVA